ncbi:hypothetical protein JTB14_034723 [Gonioctena quinquepunctata]|nr:hypothetical protein JTB14_034723 [Gonioctena quinquepunctata]
MYCSETEELFHPPCLISSERLAPEELVTETDCLKLLSETVENYSPNLTDRGPYTIAILIALARMGTGLASLRNRALPSDIIKDSDSLKLNN